MSIARKALWFIESHFTQPITLADVATAVGVSPFHLSRLFQVTTGTSLIRYLRGRRLTEAAHALARGADDILDVALSAGYSSHAAFTRAFSEQVGSTPQQVRRDGVVNATLVEAIKLGDLPESCAVAPQLKACGALLIAGIGARHRGPSVASIPSQWQRLSMEQTLPSEISYGVCCNNDEAGSFDYIAGLEVKSFASLPANWRAVRIPAGRYVVCRHEGHISSIRSTWRWMLDQHLPDAGLNMADAPEFERYGPEFNQQTGVGGVEIWLPLT
ncbi:AraC family transcriptional regulator [Frateuria aurantia]